MRMRKRKWVRPFLDEEKEYLINDAKHYQNIYLEIGMGMGDFIVESARINPDHAYIGLEKDETCVARAIKKAQENKLSNLKIMLTDASFLLDKLNEGSVKHLYLHFSDPWPKKAHHKRRLTYPTFLKIYESILSDDGYITFKTDNEELFRDSIEYFKQSNFTIRDINEDYHSIERDEPMTAYESKFVNLGKPIYYCLLSKN